MLEVKKRKSRHEGEIPRDYRISSRDPFDYYFTPQHYKAAKVKKAH
ncbi:hypothetical protein [Methanopyrus sp.]